jgi:hypothetical protein
MKKLIIAFLLYIISAPLLTYYIYDITHIYHKYKPIENILQETASRKYTEEYNCIQFSKDATEMLTKQNIQTSIIYGKDENKNWHNWIAIEFNPQTAEILKPNIYETIKLNKNHLSH